MSSPVRNVPLKNVPLATWHRRRCGHVGSRDRHSACASRGQMTLSTRVEIGENKRRFSLQCKVRLAVILRSLTVCDLLIRQPGTVASIATVFEVAVHVVLR